MSTRANVKEAVEAEEARLEAVWQEVKALIDQAH